MYLNIVPVRKPQTIPPRSKKGDMFKMVLPKITVATRSCPVLCAMADETPIPTKLTRFSFSLKRTVVTKRLKRPPQRLIKNDVVPRVISAKTALKIVIANAYGNPNAESENIVTIFEKPGFIPGTGMMGGISDSKNEIAIAKAQKTPERATFLA